MERLLLAYVYGALEAPVPSTMDEIVIAGRYAKEHLLIPVPTPELIVVHDFFQRPWPLQDKMAKFGLGLNGAFEVTFNS